MMTRKLGNLQATVLSSLTGVLPTNNTASDVHFISQDVEEGDLDNHLKLAKHLTSRFHHRCERCTPRGHVGQDSTSPWSPKIKSWISGGLFSISPLELDSTMIAESDSESSALEEQEERELTERLKRLPERFYGDYHGALKLSTGDLSVTAQTTNPTSHTPKPPTAPFTGASSTNAFERLLPPAKIRPPKLRPVVRFNGKLGRPKEVTCSRSGGRKSAMTEHPEGRFGTQKSGKTHPSHLSNTPKIVSLASPPSFLRAVSNKGVPLSTPRRMP